MVSQPAEFSDSGNQGGPQCYWTGLSGEGMFFTINKLPTDYEIHINVYISVYSILIMVMPYLGT